MNKPIDKDRPLHPVNDRQQIIENRDFVKTNMPEAVDLLRDLVALGMADGWRNLIYAGPEKPSNGITLQQINEQAIEGNARWRKGKIIYDAT